MQPTCTLCFYDAPHRPSVCTQACAACGSRTDHHADCVIAQSIDKHTRRQLRRRAPLLAMTSDNGRNNGRNNSRGAAHEP